MPNEKDIQRRVCIIAYLDIAHNNSAQHRFGVERWQRSRHNRRLYSVAERRCLDRGSTRTTYTYGLIGGQPCMCAPTLTSRIPSTLTVSYHHNIHHSKKLMGTASRSAAVDRNQSSLCPLVRTQDGHAVAIEPYCLPKRGPRRLRQRGWTWALSTRPARASRARCLAAGRRTWRR